MKKQKKIVQTGEKTVYSTNGADQTCGCMHKSTNKSNNKWKLMKLEFVSRLTDTVIWGSLQNGKKNFVSYASDRGLVSRIHRELKKINIKKNK